jgi:hypothetical protein
VTPPVVFQKFRRCYQEEDPWLQLWQKTHLLQNTKMQHTTWKLVATRIVKLLKDKIPDFDRTGLPGCLQLYFSNKNYEGLLFWRKMEQNISYLSNNCPWLFTMN